MAANIGMIIPRLDMDARPQQIAGTRTLGFVQRHTCPHAESADRPMTDDV